MAAAKPSVAGPRKGSAVMPFFWDLVSVEPETREKAALTLVITLKKLDGEKTEGEMGDDLDYALRRLVRGLASSREAAREGYSMALAEVLRQFPAITVGQVLELMEDNMSLQSVKGQEERDVLFGRLFCYLCVLRSGALARERDSEYEDYAAHLAALVKDVLAVGDQKAYLRDFSADIIALVLEQTAPDDLTAHVLNVLREPLSKPPSEYTPSLLAVALACTQTHSEMDWSSILSQWHKGRIVHRRNLPAIFAILKDPSPAHPQLYSAWGRLVGEVVSTAQGAKKKKKKKGDDDEGGWALLAQFCKLLDESFYLSTPERRHVGLLVSSLILELADPTAIAHIFTPNFVWGLVTALTGASKSGPALQATAKRTLEMLVAVGESTPEARVVVIPRILGHGKHANFDKVTKTNTVQHLLEALDAESAEVYFEYLAALFLQEVEEVEVVPVEGDAEAPPAQAQEDALTASDKRRVWILDQIYAIARSQRTAESEPWKLRAAYMFLSFAYFVAPEEATDADDAEVTRCVSVVRALSLSDSMRGICVERFSGLLKELGSPHPEPAAAAEGEDAKKRRTGKVAGTMADGEFWIYRLVAFAKALEAAGLKPAVALTEEALAARGEAAELVETIRGKLAKPDKKDKKKAAAPATDAKAGAAQERAFELLFLHVQLLLYADPEEAAGTLQELKECYVKVAEKTKKKKKGGEEEGPEPIDVLTDVLLSLLVKPSALLRDLADQVFRAFCSLVTETSLNLLLNVLTSNAPGEKGAEDEEEEVEMEVGSENGMDVEAEAEENGVDGEEDEGDDGAEDEEDEESMDVEEADEDIDEEAVSALRHKLEGVLYRKPKKGEGEPAQKPKAPKSESDSEEEVFATDEEMFKLDKMLASAFKSMSTALRARGIRDRQKGHLHFQCRVVDLLEVFVKKQPHNPLILNLPLPLIKIIARVQNRTDTTLRDKVVGMYKKLCHLRDFPRGESLDRGHAHGVLEQLFNMATNPKGTSRYVASLASLGMQLVLRILLGQKDEEAVPKTRSKAKKKGDDAAAVTAFGVLDVERATGLYRTALNGWLSKSNHYVAASLFTHLIARHPALAWRLADDFVSAGAKAHNMFLRAEGLRMLVTLLGQRHGVSNFNERLASLLPRAEGLVVGGLAVDAKTKMQQLREFLRQVSSLLSLASKAGVPISWNVPRIDASIRAIMADDRWRQSTPLRQSCGRVLTVLTGAEVKFEKPDKPAPAEGAEEAKAKRKDKKQKKKEKGKDKPSTKGAPGAAPKKNNAAAPAAGGAEDGKPSKKKRRKEKRKRTDKADSSAGGDGPARKKQKTRETRPPPQLGGRPMKAAAEVADEE